MRRLGAILRQRCPRCLEGEAWRTILTMHDVCPVCRHKFEREPGYFTGAMVVSYALAVPVLALLWLAVYVITGWDVIWTLVLAQAAFLLTVPIIFRYSRVLWMHFDWLVDPQL